MPRAWSHEILGAPATWGRGFHGAAFHALLFDLLKQKDADLAHRLHARPGQKPFGIEGPALNPQGRWIWTVKVLDPEIEAALDGWFDRLLLPVRVLGEAVTLRAIAPAVADPTWTWGERADGFTRVEPVDSLRLEWLTPTVFRVDGQDLCWPETRLVLRSWQQRWSTTSPVPLPFTDPEALASVISWSGYDLVSRRIQGGHVQATGATGRVDWHVRPGTSEAWRREIHWLARWGSWVGTGAKTAHGLGQTRVTVLEPGHARERREGHPEGASHRERVRA